MTEPKGRGAAWTEERSDEGRQCLAAPRKRVASRVLGPDNVPAVTSLAEAESDVWFTVFSALTHSRSAQVDGILKVLAVALATIETGTASLLAEFTEAGLGQTGGREIWRTLMATYSYPYVSQLRMQGRAEGKAEGKAEGLAQGQAVAVVRVLERRGIGIPARDRERILGCTDLATLDGWLDRALTVTDIGALFE